MRRHRPFILLLILTAAARLTILCVSQTHVHSDEAIIGLMGKHILDGLVHPFYMYGQPYNACAAWEAYAAAIAFAIFGVGVIPLKGCIVVLSLVSLILFYRLALQLQDRRTATLSTLCFVLAPSLLKWHFQVRGYSWYFLSLPVLTMLYWSLASSGEPKPRKVFLFGLASGVSVWCLELALTFNAALWILLALRRKLNLRSAAIAATGFMAGYAPAIIYNFTHQFANWHYLFASKAGGGHLSALFQPSTVTDILFQEMPKFFGSDTVMWYYAEKPVVGYVFYLIALAAVALAAWPFVRTPSKILQAVTGTLADSNQDKDLLMLALTAACFAPYLIAPMRVPAYFLGGCFFLAILEGRLLQRCFAPAASPLRWVGAATVVAACVAGIVAMLEMASRNQIDTTTLQLPDNQLRLTRIPGADIDAVEQHLYRNHATSVWTTISFIYPLRFESRESLITSSSIFGIDARCYPPTVPWREPAPDQPAAFVMESHSPYFASTEEWCAKKTGAPATVTICGTLAVIEETPRLNPAQ